MDTLWAPWRIEYVTHPKTEGCVFCNAIARGPNAEDYVLHVGPLAAIVMNRFPYGHAHLLVLPRRHTADFSGLSREEHAELSDLLRVCTEVLQATMYPHGFNIGMNLGQAGGAGILDHLHWHILPRWPGDVNALALICEVRSIPEHLAATYAKLRPQIQKRLG